MIGAFIYLADFGFERRIEYRASKFKKEPAKDCMGLDTNVNSLCSNFTTSEYLLEDIQAESSEASTEETTSNH